MRRDRRLIQSARVQGGWTKLGRLRTILRDRLVARGASGAMFVAGSPTLISPSEPLQAPWSSPRTPTFSGSPNFPCSLTPMPTRSFSPRAGGAVRTTHSPLRCGRTWRISRTGRRIWWVPLVVPCQGRAEATRSFVRSADNTTTWCSTEWKLAVVPFGYTTPSCRPMCSRTPWSLRRPRFNALATSSRRSSLAHRHMRGLH